MRSAARAGLLLAVLSGLAPLAAQGQTQQEITALALGEFAAKAAGFPADTPYYLNQYLNGIPGRYPPYEGTLLTWGETYLGMANLTMYQAAGDPQYLENLLRHAEVMYGARADRVSPPIPDQVRNRQMPAFVSFNSMYAPQAATHSWLIVSAYQSYPVTFAIAGIKGDPELTARFGARADPLLADIGQTLDSFDEDFRLISGGRGRYVDPYLKQLYPYTSGNLPFNMQSGAGQAYIGLWKATGNPRYYDRAVALAKTLKAELTPIGDRYSWRYAPYDAAGSASDVSHAGMDVAFAIDAYEAGIVFNDTDIQRLANTFRYVRRPTGFTDYVNGTGSAPADNIRLMSAWLPLVQYDAALRQDMFPVYQSYWRTDCCSFPMLGAAAFYKAGTYHASEGAFREDFDGTQLSPRWRRPAAQPIGNSWTAETADSQFTVSEIATSTQGSWADIVRTRDVDQDASWEVSFDFSWDSTQGSADPRQAMQRFFVDLRDDTGSLFAQIGISDSWHDRQGGRVLQLFNSSLVEPFDSLAPSGAAAVRIRSDPSAGRSEVFWNDALLLTAPTTASLKQVGLRFGHYRHFVSGQLRSHFGAIAVDAVDVANLEQRPPSVVALDGFDDGNRQPTPGGIAWRTHSHPPATLGMAVVDDTAGLGSGNALRVDPQTTGQSIMGVFESPVTLPEAVGSKLTLRFEMRNEHTGSVPGSIRFGLYDADEFGFPVLGGFGGVDGDWDASQPGSRSDPGVFVQQLNDPALSCCSAANATRLAEESGALGSQFGGGDERYVAQAPNDFPGLAPGNGKTVLSLELERLAPGSAAGAWRYAYVIDNGMTTASLLGTHLGSDSFAGGSSATGTFDYFSLSYDGVAGGLANFLIDNFSIRVTVPDAPPDGDYNQDGNVDGDDLLAWQSGRSPAPGSARDLAAWEARFGAGASRRLGLPVPEIPGGALAGLGLLGGSLRRRRRPAVSRRLDEGGRGPGRGFWRRPRRLPTRGTRGVIAGIARVRLDCGSLRRECTLAAAPYSGKKAGGERRAAAD